MKLERSADKDEILERYLNTVYFGRGAYGIEAAARVVLRRARRPTSTPARRRCWSGSSGRRSRPTRWRTWRRPWPAATASSATWSPTASSARPRPTRRSPHPSRPPTAPRRRRRPPAWPRTSSSGSVSRWSPSSGEDALYGRGLRVVTTLDLDAQRAAEAAVAEVITDPAGPQAALVALDEDGAIRAHVGEPRLRDPEGRPRSRRRRRRLGPPAGLHLQAVRAPGRARSDGVTLADRFPGPPQIEVDVGGTPFPVENYGGSGFGELTRGRRHEAAR